MILKRIATVTIASGAALALAAGPALAAVSYSPSTGGFAGKGDVATLFGWNDAQTQANASSAEFDFKSVTIYRQECLVQIGSDKAPKTKEKTQQEVVKVSSTVAFDTRAKKNKAVTGFNLAAVSGSAASAPTNLCDEAEGEENIEGEDVYVHNSDGGLRVSHGGVTHDLPNTPVV